jgi:hypothetical protein
MPFLPIPSEVGQRSAEIWIGVINEGVAGLSGQFYDIGRFTFKLHHKLSMLGFSKL